MKQFKLTLVLTVLMSMVGVQAFADWDTSTKVQVDGLYYYLDNDNLQAQVTSKPDGEYTGDIGIPSTLNYQSKTYGVTSISKYAFKGCSSLTSVTIPNSVTSIGNCAFEDCPNLASIVVESGNPNYDSRNDCNAIIETASNTLIAGCKNTIIPNNVTSIGSYAFYGCSGLTSITIPNSVTSISDEAFSGCSGLTSVTALNPTPVAITQYVFTNRTNATLYVPKGSKDAYKAADYWKEFKEIVEIDPTGIDQISFQENGEQVIDQEGAVWYTIDGKQLDKPKKGINIIRMKNGTTKKVVVK